MPNADGIAAFALLLYLICLVLVLGRKRRLW